MIRYTWAFRLMPYGVCIFAIEFDLYSDGLATAIYLTLEFDARFGLTVLAVILLVWLVYRL